MKGSGKAESRRRKKAQRNKPEVRSQKVQKEDKLCVLGGLGERKRFLAKSQSAQREARQAKDRLKEGTEGKTAENREVSIGEGQAQARERL